MFESINNYQNLLSAQKLVFPVILLMVWQLVWKGIALWKSSRDDKKVWFIYLLIFNFLGLFSIAYIFLFSKIKDNFSFKKIHDLLLILLAISILLMIWKQLFVISFFLAMVLFGISMIQKSLDRKEWAWLVFGILLMPIIPIVYYFLKIRNEEELIKVVKKAPSKKKPALKKSVAKPKKRKKKK
ncbi:DUF5652 family protein [Nanoarchaeota archaeon]